MQRPNEPITINFFFLSSLIGILIWMFTCRTHAQPPQIEPLPLKAYTARYQIHVKGIPMGESVHHLRHHDNGIYRLSVQTEPYLSLLPYRYLARSDFRWVAGEVVPHHHYYNTKELKRNKIGTVYFDWRAKRLENQQASPPWHSDITQGMQDKLSHVVKLRMDLLKGKREHLHYMVAEETKILPYDFTILRPEILQTKIGNVNTLKVKHIDHKDQTTLFWLASDYEYIPVRAEHYRKGSKIGGGEILAYSQMPVS